MLRNISLTISILVLTGFLGCDYSDDPNYSGSYDSNLNISGHYIKMTGPSVFDASSITVTQDYSSVSIVDSRGVLYEGAMSDTTIYPPPQEKTDVTPGTYPDSTGARATGTCTVEGTDNQGRRVTMVLQPQLFYFNIAANEAGALPVDETNVDESARVEGLTGTYIDSAGNSGSVEFRSTNLEYGLSY